MSLQALSRTQTRRFSLYTCTLQQISFSKQMQAVSHRVGVLTPEFRFTRFLPKSRPGVIFAPNHRQIGWLAKKSMASTGPQA